MSAPCVPTSPHQFRLIATPLVSFWFCMTTSMSFHARRHAILSPFQYTFAPFDPPCLTFISSIFLLSPFPSPHLSTFNSLHPLVIRLISIPSHEQKRCTKSNFLFIFFALKHRNTRNSSKHSLRGLSMYLFPPVVFISHKQKKGIRVLFRKWKKGASRYNRRYQKLKITQILFFFF